VVSPYWMKSIGPAVAAVNKGQTSTAVTQIRTASPAMQAGGQK
jgi:hypothetical protein